MASRHSRADRTLSASALRSASHSQPELGAFGLLDPDPQHVAGVVGQDAERQVHRLVADDGVFPDLDPQCVEEDHWVHRL